MLTDNEEAVLLNLQTCMMANAAAFSSAVSIPQGSQAQHRQPDAEADVESAGAGSQQPQKDWSQVTTHAFVLLQTMTAVQYYAAVGAALRYLA